MLVPAALLKGSYRPSPNARAGCVVLMVGKNGVLRSTPTVVSEMKCGLTVRV